MSRYRHITAYIISALVLLLTAALFLLASPAQAHYTAEARWQSPIPAQVISTPTSALHFTCMTQPGDMLQLGRWYAQSGEVKDVLLALTYDQRAAADGQTPAEAVVTFTASSGNTQLLLASTAMSQSMIPGNSYSIPISLTRTAQAITADTPVTFTVTAVSQGQTIMRSDCRIVLKANTAALEPEESTLLGRCMTSYDPKQPFCVTFSLPSGCLGAEMRCNNGDFPSNTRYSTDGGLSYAVLAEEGAIQLDTHAASLLVDLNQTALRYGTSSLRLTLAAETGNRCQTQTIELGYEPWAGDTPAATAADGAVNGVRVTWGGAYCAADIQVEKVSKNVYMLQDTEHPEAPPKTVVEVFCTAVAEGVFTPCGTTVSDETTGTIAEYRGVETNETTPAGSYRLTVTWRLEGIQVAQKEIVFFISR